MNSLCEIIKISPNPIIISELEPGETDSIDFFISNYSKKLTKIRISLPFNSPFKLNSQSDFSLSPGLQERRIITYTATSEVAKTELTISVPGRGSFTVPVIFYPPSAIVDVNKKDFDLGIISQGFSHSETFNVTNFGIKDGDFHIRCENEDVEIIPKDVTILSSQSQSVEFKYKPNKVGDFDFNISIEVAGGAHTNQEVRVHGTSRDHSVKVLYEDEEAKNISFGRLYFGQKVKKTLTLVNKAPLKRTFVFQMLIDKNDENKIDNDLFLIQPQEGEISPNSSKEVTVTFQPRLQKLENDDEILYNNTLSLDILKTPISVPIALEASAVQMQFNISCLDFVFPDVIVDKSTTKTFTIENTSEYKDIQYSIKKIAHFHFKPASGVLKKKQKVEVEVSFDPRSLGEHDTTTTISLCGGIITRTIQLKGVARTGTIDEKRKKVPIWESDPNVAYSLKHPNTKYALTKEEIDKKKVQKEIFDEFINTAARARKDKLMKAKLKGRAETDAKHFLQSSKIVYSDQELAEETAKRLDDYIKGYDENDSSYGMEYGEGLEPPAPPDSLTFVKRAPRKGLKSTNRSEVKGVVGTFKAKPESNAEITECSKPLSPSQQLSVFMDKETIDFDKVSVTARKVQKMQFTNNLSQNVFIQLCLDDTPEFALTTPISQVVPPSSVAVFDVVLCSNEQKVINRKLKYTVNNNTEGSVTLIGTTVPIVLNLNKREIDFDFANSTSQVILRDTVSIHNPTDALARFNWIGLDNIFKITPTQGEIKAHDKFTCEVTYNPGTTPASELRATLGVKGGLEIPFFLRGTTGNPKVVLSTNSVDYDLVSLGIPITKEVIMKNEGSDPAVFLVQPSELENLTITPSSGRLLPHQELSLKFTLKCLKPTDINQDIEVLVCGHNTEKINIIGHAENPQIELLFNTLEYGKIFIGNSETKKIKIRNSGHIPAVVTLDLTHFSPFFIEYDPKLGSQTVDGKHNSIVDITNTETDESQISSLAHVNGGGGRMYQISIIEGSEITCDLIFKPEIVSDFSFELPITMADNTFITSSVQPLVIAEGIQAPLSASLSLIDFGITPIYDPLNPNIRPNSKKFIIRNRTKNSINFRIDSSDIGDLFVVKPLEGFLESNTDLPIIATFRPKEIDPVLKTIKLYAKQDEEEELLTSTIQLTGFGFTKAFTTDVESVVLPIVPLNVKAEKVIRIINTRFIDSSLSVVMPISEKNFPLKVNFVGGGTLQHSVQSTTMAISFQSDKPLSFSTVIAIIDDLGNSHKLAVSACTDNSVFTLYPVLSCPTLNVNAIVGKPLTATSRKPIPDDFIGGFANSQGLYEELEKLEDYRINDVQVEFTLLFLNSFILTTKISDLVEGFASSEGDLVYEMIMNMSGPKKPSFKSDTSTTLAKLKSLLTNLTSLGALVSRIQPEFLLSKERFIDFYHKKIVKQILGINYIDAPEISTINQKELTKYTSLKIFKEKFTMFHKMVESLYTKVATESWLCIVNQIFKLFLFTKLGPEKLSAVPGFLETMKTIKEKAKDSVYTDLNKPMKVLSASNLMSVQEGALLKWVSAYYCQNNLLNDKTTALHSFIELKDPKVLACAFENFIPSLKFEDSNDLEENAKKLQQFILTLRLNFVPSITSLLSGNEPMYALIAYEVFQTLPHYIPSTDIEFDAELNETVTRQLTITNPSRNELVYNTKLVGSSFFKLEHSKFTLQPGETQNITISYFAKSHESEVATLTLLPLRPVTETEPVVASAIAVNLVSNITIKKPKRVFNMEGPLYEQTKYVLPISNEIKKKGTYLLHTQYGYKTIDGKVMQMDPLSTFVSNRSQRIQTTTEEEDEGIKTLEDKIEKHCPFIIRTKEITFEDEKAQKEVEITFNPISIGKYTLQLHFYNDMLGEFVYELDADTLMHDSIESISRVKTECTVKQSIEVPVESVNKYLLKALAYSIACDEFKDEDATELKIRDRANNIIKELSTYSMRNGITEFNVEFTSNFFSGPHNYSLSNTEPENLPVSFIPTKPGTYPCRIVLSSTYDTRIIKIEGTSIALTKNIDIELEVSANKSVKQEIPFTNPSDNVWNYKITVEGDPGFDINPRLTVKPKSTSPITIIFKSRKKGVYTARIHVVNLVKESVINYNVKAIVSDPLSEEKIALKCQARQHMTKRINLPYNLVQNGVVNITTDIPIINFKNEIKYIGGKPAEPLILEVYALRSGISVGSIVVTDPTSDVFIWYNFEAEVSRPDPEQVIKVSTIERHPVSINFPVYNPKDYPVSFDIIFSDNDLNGKKKIIIPPKGNISYNVDFLPLTASTRTSYVMFFNDTEGEYNYLLNINVEEDAPQTLAPFHASIGNYSTSYIKIENLADKLASFRYEIDDVNAFHVNLKPVFTIRPKESKVIEVKYTPTKVGTKETSIIRFKSKETGTYSFFVSGVGKPPQSLPPQIVEAGVNVTASSSIVFTNPFSFPCTFDATLINEEGNHFKLLNKKKSYLFTEYAETQQISFSFFAATIGQFNGAVIVTTSGTQDKITWNYPLIGVTLSGDKTVTPEIRGRSGQSISKNFVLPLAGEMTENKVTNYSVFVECPNGYNWVMKYISAVPISVSREAYSTSLEVRVDFIPKRPLDIILHFAVQNRNKQTWRFPLSVHIEPSMANAKIIIESVLNKLQPQSVFINDPINTPTEFRAYFMQGSASELTLTKSDGVIEPSEGDVTQLPFDIMFLPKTYGKLVRGILVVDTEESEYVFDVYGKMPDYIPPQVTMPKIDTSMPKSARFRNLQTANKRTSIKNSIGKGKITKPLTSRNYKRSYE